MASMANYIESQYRKIMQYINIEYIDLYQSFSNEKLREIFSTIQHLFAENYSAMNSRLPTGEYGNHFWADKSRALILAISVLKGLERVLNNTDNAFIIDSYYSDIIEKSLSFLVESGGSQIPPHMDKVTIYYSDPILRKKDTIELRANSSFTSHAELKKIGSGSYAEVYMYYDPFYNRKYVIKCAKSSLSPKEFERFRQEYEQMNSLHSPYVVEVYHYSEDKKEYIMEYMDCTLSDYLLNFRPKPDLRERRRIVLQVLCAFRYIHSKGLLHRDISPNNILLKTYDDVKVVKVSDFGLVKVPDSDLTTVETDFKGSFNDPALMTEGFINYNMFHEVFAITKLICFIMTDSAILVPNCTPSFRAFVEKGLNPDKSQRYRSVDEIKQSFQQVLQVFS